MNDLLSYFVRLADHVSLRLLETPFLYDRRNDELYELDSNGFRALLDCDGRRRASHIGLDPLFLETCVEENLVSLSTDPILQPFLREKVIQSSIPSLRYLELQITWRCNLSCRHCYLGRAKPIDLPVDKVFDAINQFERMGGLRLLITGGEPLAHPDWPAINEMLRDVPLRRVLLTNGLLLNGSFFNRLRLEDLNVDEVQISLDGVQVGHEVLRGKGTFRRAVQAARRVVNAGVDLSVATMVHSRNLNEFDELGELVRELDAREWSIDVPCIAGRMDKTSGLGVSPFDGAKAMGHAFGAAYHGSGEGMACGLHLCTVSANGLVAQCGYYLDKALGRIDDGLRACWEKRVPLGLAEIPKCALCGVAEDCGGGCRFRAPSLDEPDEVMCALMRS